MKNLTTLQPDKVLLLDRHFTRGRGGRTIKKIALHHTAGILDAAAINRVWKDRPASAHYLIDPQGIISQHVWDRDTAWANANLQANQESITIEHSNSGGAAQDWPINEITRRKGAEWVAAICVFYKLGRPQWGVNVVGHSDFHATSCPYHLRRGQKYHDEYMRWAGEAYDRMTGKTPPPPTSSTPQIGDPMRLIRSLVNTAKSFTQDTMLALIDRATWEIRVIVNELARKQGIDPDTLVADAIRKDNQNG